MLFRSFHDGLRVNPRGADHIARDLEHDHVEGPVQRLQQDGAGGLVAARGSAVSHLANAIVARQLAQQCRGEILFVALHQQRTPAEATEALQQEWVRYHTLPTPGVYDAETTALLISTSHCTTPLNMDMPASTLTMPDVTCTIGAFTLT